MPTKPKGVDFLFDRDEWRDAINHLSPRHKLYWRENFNFEPTIGKLYPDSLKFHPEITPKKNKFPDPPTAAQNKAFEDAIAMVMIDRGWMPAEDSTVNKRELKKAKPVEKGAAKGFVYFIRNQDLHKVGITLDLQRRLKELNPDEVINTVKCSNYEALELRIHKKFSKERVPQTEYFRLTDAQVSEVEQMMMAEVK